MSYTPKAAKFGFTPGERCILTAPISRCSPVSVGSATPSGGHVDG